MFKSKLLTLVCDIVFLVAFAVFEDISIGGFVAATVLATALVVRGYSMFLIGFLLIFELVLDYKGLKILSYIPFIGLIAFSLLSSPPQSIKILVPAVQAEERQQEEDEGEGEGEGEGEEEDRYLPVAEEVTAAVVTRAAPTVTPAITALNPIQLAKLEAKAAAEERLKRALERIQASGTGKESSPNSAKKRARQQK